jgi:hypothetical protein
MKVKDKDINEDVDVYEKACVTDNRLCYWPRPDPGVFTIGYISIREEL